MKFRRKVLHGEKLGRQLGFPTVNFHVGNFGRHFSPGVYACTVMLNHKWLVSSGQWSVKESNKLPTTHYPLATFQGALYFGPKGRGRNVLEIHLLDFKGDLYGQFASFEVGKKIRNPIPFKSLENLKKAIKKDIETIRRVR